MSIQRHSNDSLQKFFFRTVAAQTHLLGAIAAFAGTMVLAHLTFSLPNSEHYWACLAFGITGIMVFGASASYHFLADGFQIPPRLHLLLDNLDHYSIYLFIAGSYTVFIVNVIAPPWKAILLIMIWSIAFAGVIYTRFKPILPLWAQHRYVYTSLFIIMGWTLIIRIGEIFSHLSLSSAALLVGGGLSYSLGAVGYATKRPKLFPGIFGYHELWHLMVVFGFVFHFMLVLRFYNA
jgi:hemolysin III